MVKIDFYIKIFILIIIISITLFLIIYLINSKKIEEENNTKENFENTNNIKKSFIKCNKNKVKGIISDIFVKNNIYKNKTDTNWDIYLPCGYNNVEAELKTIIPTNDNQIIFGISGCDKAVSKNNIWSLLENKYGREKASSIMPETYILNNKEHMNLFVIHYQPSHKYILKKNVQRKEGLLMTNQLTTIVNANKEGYKVVQKYLKDVFLINNRKINLRIYLVIKCMNGVINAFIHPRGKCIYTNKDYDPDSLDFENNITSYNLELEIYKINPLTFEELKEYLKKINLDYDLLFNRIITIIKETIIASKKELCQLKNIYKNTTFQLFGLDVIFNNKLEPFLLEFNKGPDMQPKTDVDRIIKTKVQEDMFDLVHLIYNTKNEFIKIL